MSLRPRHSTVSLRSPEVPPGPLVTALPGPFGCALSVDVEEWYRTCLVPEWVDPSGRPELAEELDTLLPRLLEMLARAGRSATFFVLGEVAARLPGRVRELAAAGHEVASHSELHLRASALRPAAFREAARTSRQRLEDLIGSPVHGFRAPEWSLRRVSHPYLEILAEVGYFYDSSLMPAVGSGSPRNPRVPARLSWPGGRELVELPPLVWGPRRFPLPMSGWTARPLPAALWRWRVGRALAAGGLPVAVIHPWELVDRPTPGLMTGFARFVHDTGRRGFAARLEAVLGGLPWTSLREAFRGGDRWRSATTLGASTEEAPRL